MKQKYGRSDLRVNWKSYYSVGAISAAELALARAVEQRPQDCSDQMIRLYFQLRAKNHLLDGQVPPRPARLDAGTPSEKGAYDALLEVMDKLSPTEGLKLQLIRQLEKYRIDYRAEWNRMLGFEMFDLSLGETDAGTDDGHRE